MSLIIEVLLACALSMWITDRLLNLGERSKNG